MLAIEPLFARACDLCHRDTVTYCGWCRLAMCMAHAAEHPRSQLHTRRAAPMSPDVLVQIEQILLDKGVDAPPAGDKPGAPKPWCMNHNADGNVVVWKPEGYEVRPCECRYVADERL